MHNYSNLLRLMLVPLLLAACTTETYDSGDGTYSYLTGELVVAHATGKNSVDYVLTDDGDSLRMPSDFTFSSVAKADTFYRGQLYYSKVGDNQAEPLAFGVIPTLPVYPLERIREMKSDPVRFESVWKAKTKPYVNICFYAMTGTIDGETASQTVAIAQNGDTLTLYHDQNDVPEYYSTRIFASIPFSYIDKDSFLLRINTYDGWKEFRMGK